MRTGGDAARSCCETGGCIVNGIGTTGSTFCIKCVQQSYDLRSDTTAVAALLQLVSDDCQLCTTRAPWISSGCLGCSVYRTVRWMTAVVVDGTIPSNAAPQRPGEEGVVWENI